MHSKDLKISIDFRIQPAEQYKSNFNVNRLAQQEQTHTQSYWLIWVWDLLCQTWQICFFTFTCVLHGSTFSLLKHAKSQWLNNMFKNHKTPQSALHLYSSLGPERLWSTQPETKVRTFMSLALMWIFCVVFDYQADVIMFCFSDFTQVVVFPYKRCVWFPFTPVITCAGEF